jgi:hypothetical protein
MKMAGAHRMDIAEDEPARLETVADLLMDIRVSANLMSKQSEARRTLLRCAMALVYLAKDNERMRAVLAAADSQNP